MTYTISQLKKELLKEKGERTWAKLAEDYSDDEFVMNPATLWRIVYGSYEPKRADIRRKLGLPTPVTTYQGTDGKFVKHDRSG